VGAGDTTKPKELKESNESKESKVKSPKAPKDLKKHNKSKDKQPKGSKVNNEEILGSILEHFKDMSNQQKQFKESLNNQVNRLQARVEYIKELEEIEKNDQLLVTEEDIANNQNKDIITFNPNGSFIPIKNNFVIKDDSYGHRSSIRPLARKDGKVITQSDSILPQQRSSSIELLDRNGNNRNRNNRLLKYNDDNEIIYIQKDIREGINIEDRNSDINRSIAQLHRKDNNEEVNNDNNDIIFINRNNRAGLDDFKISINLNDKQKHINNINNNNISNISNIENNKEVNLTQASSQRPINKILEQENVSSKPKFEVNIDENLENFDDELDKINPYKTLKDIEEITYMEKLKYDSRKFGLYYWDILLEEHLIITIFCKNSLFIPRYIRIIKSLGTITLTFC